MASRLRLPVSPALRTVPLIYSDIATVRYFVARAPKDDADAEIIYLDCLDKIVKRYSVVGRIGDPWAVVLDNGMIAFYCCLVMRDNVESLNEEAGGLFFTREGEVGPIAWPRWWTT